MIQLQKQSQHKATDVHMKPMLATFFKLLLKRLRIGEAHMNCYCCMNRVAAYYIPGVQTSEQQQQQQQPQPLVRNCASSLTGRGDT